MSALPAKGVFFNDWRLEVDAKDFRLCLLLEGRAAASIQTESSSRWSRLSFVVLNFQWPREMRNRRYSVCPTYFRIQTFWDSRLDWPLTSLIHPFGHEICLRPENLFFQGIEVHFSQRYFHYVSSSARVLGTIRNICSDLPNLF